MANGLNGVDGMQCSGVQWNGVDGMQCSGVEWNGVDEVHCSGVEWSRWNALQWSGMESMECIAVEWNGMDAFWSCWVVLHIFCHFGSLFDPQNAKSKNLGPFSAAYQTSLTFYFPRFCLLLPRQKCS